MGKTLSEYADWLDDRADLIWPKLPEPKPAKATAYLKPLGGIRLVTWSIYGTLLRIADGELLFDHPQKLRMQIALEKTVEEFNMWNSMYRKPGAPWEYMYEQYGKQIEKQKMAGGGRKGDLPEINAAEIWNALIGQLRQKDYTYDESTYGDWDEFALKVAYFFHRNLQAVEAAKNCARALSELSGRGVPQGLLTDAQPFTLLQLLRALKDVDKLPPFGELFDSRFVVQSDREGVRKPSPSLFRKLVSAAEEAGIEPNQILHVTNRIEGDLAVAKENGFRTALYAGDKDSLKATSAQVKDPKQRPDRLLTDLIQVLDILQ